MRISLGKSINLEQAKFSGLQVGTTQIMYNETVAAISVCFFYIYKNISTKNPILSHFQACIERMLNLTDHLRRLRVDKYEYVAMKVIVLLQSGKYQINSMCFG